MSEEFSFSKITMTMSFTTPKVSREAMRKAFAEASYFNALKRFFTIEYLYNKYFNTNRC